MRATAGWTEYDCSYIGASHYEFNEAAADYLRDYYEDTAMDERGNMSDLEDEYLLSFEGAIVFEDTDIFCMFMAALEDGDPTKKYAVTATYSHIIWLFHDLVHVTQHTDPQYISVFEDCELEAITKSIAMLIENKIPVPWEVVFETIHLYNERFNARKSIEDVLPKNYEHVDLETANFTLNYLTRDPYETHS